MPVDMMKVQPDMGTIFANIQEVGITGPIQQYCLARMHGHEITPELAKWAYDDAEKLINAGKIANTNDISVGAGKTISMDLLEALCNDIKSYAKVAASRQSILKLATEFAKKIK